MKLKKKKNKTVNKKKIRSILVIGIAGLTILAGCTSTGNSSHWCYKFAPKYTSTDTSQNTPTEKLGRSVLTLDVIKQLGGQDKIKWNNAGAFIINNNQTDLNANVTSAPYATNSVDKMNRPTVGDALLNKTTREYQNRVTTNNGAKSWKPQGYQQVKLRGRYNHAYDRGHLLGYALVGNIRGFDASESNPKNIATQTMWANESHDVHSTGQNYYEGLVRKALDQGKTVRYRVTDIYNGNDVVPSGVHMEAKSSDDSLQYNVFVPNVQSNISINYATGAVTPQ